MIDMIHNNHLCHLPESRRDPGNAVEQRMKKRIISCTLLPALLAVLLPSIASAQQSYSLDDLITMGLERNPRLLAQTMQARADRAAWQASRRLFNPALEYEFGSGESYDGTVSRNLSGITVSQLLENPVKRHHRIQMAESEWKAADLTRRAIGLEIVFKVKEHAYLLLLLKAREDLARKGLESLEEAHRLIATRVRLGETRELEAIRLQVEVMRARYQLNSILTEKRFTARYLNALLGDGLPDDFEIEGELTWEPTPVNAEAYLAGALQSHPLIGRSESELAFARSQLGMARSLIIPDPQISGFRAEELDGRISGVGISIEIPLWNQNAKEVVRTRSIADMKRYELEMTQLDLSTEIAVRMGNLELSAERIEIFQEGLLNQAEMSLKLSETSYRQGEISLLEYLDAQRTYYSILNDYQDSLYNWNLDRAALQKAVGEEIR